MPTTSDWGTREVGLLAITKDEKKGLKVSLGFYDASMEDFLFAVEHLLTATDLEPDDPRLQFVKCIKSMKKIKNDTTGAKRLKAFIPPIAE